jgi:hypothetical protein
MSSSEWQIEELNADQVRELASQYAGQPAAPSLDPVMWTKETLALDLLKKAHPDTRFFSLAWHGYAAPMDAPLGEKVLICQTRDGEVTGRIAGEMLRPRCVGQYVRLEGKGYEGKDQHLMLVFLDPQP